MHHSRSLRCKLEPGVLLEGERVHVRTQENRSAWPVPAQRRHHAARLRARLKIEGQAFEALEDRGTGDGKLQTELGRPVNPPTKLYRFRQKLSRLGEKRRKREIHGASPTRIVAKFKSARGAAATGSLLTIASQRSAVPISGGRTARPCRMRRSSAGA